MNQMPKLNSAEISPLIDDSASAESEVSLSVPSHEEFDKPMLEDSQSNNSTNVAAVLAPKKGIEVVAMSSGFYNQKRIREGESFFIKSEQEFGSWMKCKDSAMEKKRIEFYKLKKAK